MTMSAKRFPEAGLPPHIQEIADGMNLDPDAVPEYEISPVPADAAARQQVMDHFTGSVYGEIPPKGKIGFRIRSAGSAFNGLAVRREIDIICSNGNECRELHLLLYIPAHVKGQVPCFFGLNFVGNTDTTAEAEVTFHPFVRYQAEFAWHADRRVDENDRGAHAYRWEFEKVLRAGFATATMCCFDIYPDHPDGFEKSVMPLFYSAELWNSPQRPSGAVSAWAWGISRAIDCLLTQPEISPDKIIVHGLSRLGKTALWAGANDPRIAAAAAICSGTLGAKLTRRYFGESLDWLLFWRQYWFVPAINEFRRRDGEVPVDQHALMSCIAPRGLYVASAGDDDYADPEGERLGALHAAAAWQDKSRVRYFIREGGHDFTPENWDDLLQYAAAFVSA